MKKIILYLTFCLFGIASCLAQTYSVHVSNSGTLIDLIGVNDIEGVIELTVSGDLNGTDILAIRKMVNLEILDMSNSNIVAGGASYYETYTTSENKIGDYFFKDKSSLSIVTLPTSIVSIGNYTFNGCVNLKSISIPNSVTMIGNSAFLGCSGLKSVIIPDSVITVGAYSFSNCDGLTSLTIGNAVATIASFAFSGCSKLSSLTIPNSVIVIGSHAFADCRELKDIVLEDGTKNLSFGTDYSSNSRDAFNNCPIESLYLGRNITYYIQSSSDASYSLSPFRDKATLKSLNIGNTVTSIGNGAFYYCQGLASLTIGSSVVSIGESAFDNCNGLTTLTIPNSVTTIEKKAFMSFGLKNIVLEDTTMPLSFGTGSGFAFGATIESLYLGRNITYSNADSPFCNQANLTSLTIGNSVTSIGNSAFRNCKGLMSLTFGNSITTIGQSAFSGCNKLVSLSIPNSVIVIGGHAFADCDGLTSLSIGDSVTTIGYYAFSGCSGLMSLTIPNSVVSIEESAFRDCNGCTSLIFGNSVSTIGFAAFSGCNGLTSLIIPNSVIAIGGYAFASCSELALLTIGNSVATIGEYAFSNCLNLMEINTQNPIPPQAQNSSFDGIDKQSCILYVPIGSVTTYWLHPIWEDFFNIKEKDFPSTGVTLVDAEGYVSVYITNDGLVIKGCNPQDKISVYSTNGQMIYDSIVGNGLVTYPFEKGDIYIVHTPKKTFKVIY